MTYFEKSHLKKVAFFMKTTQLFAYVQKLL